MAVELELRRARALRRLRGVLNEACGKEGKKVGEAKKKEGEKKGGGDKEGAAPPPSPPSAPPPRLGIGASPLLAFERWMWACAAAGESGGRAADPAVPSPSAPFEPGLAAALARAGAGRAASEAVARSLSAESRRLAAAIAREARARASSGGGKGGKGGRGGAAEEGQGAVAVTVSVHKHSLDLCAAAAAPPTPSPSSPSPPPASPSSSKEFIKISRPAYCRLLRAFRECGPEAERPPKLPGSAADAAAADDDAEVAAAAADAPPSPPPSAPPPPSASPSPSPRSRAAFHSRLFAMLLRYRSLAGPGFHAGVGAPVCAALARTVGTGLEGFASPVNARWARFGCAFADVDAVFGGLGSFFEEGTGGGRAAAAGKERGGGGGPLSASKLLLPVGGSVLVNPPFEPGLLLSAARCCVTAVEEASEQGTRLAVVFVGPRWSGGGGGGGGGLGDSSKEAFACALSASSSSSCLEHSFTVAAAQHGYRDGAPHAARDPYRRSPFDTGVFLLRSRAEREKRPLRDLKQWEREVREAFKLCLPSAEAAERQRTARGSTDRKGWGGEGEAGKKASAAPPSSLRASIEARQRLKAERRKGSNGGNAPHSALSPSGKRWVKKSKMNSSSGGGAGKRKEGGGGGGGGGEAKRQKK